MRSRSRTMEIDGGEVTINNSFLFFFFCCCFFVVVAVAGGMRSRHLWEPQEQGNQGKERRGMPMIPSLGGGGKEKKNNNLKKKKDCCNLSLSLTPCHMVIIISSSSS